MMVMWGGWEELGRGCRLYICRFVRAAGTTCARARVGPVVVAAMEVAIRPAPPPARIRWRARDYATQRATRRCGRRRPTVRSADGSAAAGACAPPERPVQPARAYAHARPDSPHFAKSRATVVLETDVL